MIHRGHRIEVGAVSEGDTRRSCWVAFYRDGQDPGGTGVLYDGAVYGDGKDAEALEAAKACVDAFLDRGVEPRFPGGRRR